MPYTEDDLKKIQEYASLLMKISDIAVLLEMDEDELRESISIKTSGPGIAYRKGKTQTVLDLRRQEIELGKAGSTIGIELTQKYMLEQTLNENG